MLTPRPVSAAVAAALAVSLAGCGPAAKQAAVRKVDAAASHVGLRTGTLTLTIAPKSGGLRAVPTGVPATAGVVLDTSTRDAALVAPASFKTRLTGGRVLTLFAHSLVYSRTADGDVVGARPWFRLDTAHLGGLNHEDAQDLAKPATLGDLVVLNPLTVIEQAHGLLTGSVKISQSTTVTAPSTGKPVPAVEYSGNTSLQKVARQLHLDPDREKPTRDLLAVFAIKQDINPISVWLSPAGDLLRIRIAFVAKPLKRVAFKVVYDLVLDPPTSTADAAALSAPTRDDVVDVTSLGELSLALEKLAGASA